MTKRRELYNCIVCGAEHRRDCNPSQAKYCSEGCQILSRVAPAELANPVGCWNWTGYVHPTGYGQLTLNGAVRRAHRASFEEFIGPVPSGHYVCHRCDNPKCINPAHLFAGPPQANSNDAKAKGRIRKGEAHGMAELTEEQALAIRSSTERPRALARRYGVSERTIFDIWTGHSWKHLPPRSQLVPRGWVDQPSIYRRKLTPDLAASIRQEHIRGSRTHGTKALARKYGVSPGAVWAVVEGKSWTGRGAYLLDETRARREHRGMWK